MTFNKIKYILGLSVFSKSFKVGICQPLYPSPCFTMSSIFKNPSPARWTSFVNGYQANKWIKTRKIKAIISLTKNNGLTMNVLSNLINSWSQAVAGLYVYTRNFYLDRTSLVYTIVEPLYYSGQHLFSGKVSAIIRCLLYRCLFCKEITVLG